jgi:hypothetical protein
MARYVKLKKFTNIRHMHLNMIFAGGTPLKKGNGNSSYY